MADKTPQQMLQEASLTIREHLDPDKHWIGEALATPTQTEIAATVGNVSGTGDSPFVARADHLHKLGTGVVGNSNIANNAVTGAKIQDGTIDQSEFVDSGWISMTLDPNWSGASYMRKVAGFVWINFAPSRNAGGGPSDMIPMVVPAGFRPGIAMRGIAHVTGPVNQVRMQIGTDGIFTAFALTINAGSLLYGSISYPI